jgi:MFS family permease
LSNEPNPKRRHLADLTPLRESPAFARLWVGTILNGLGTQLTLVAVALQIYAITHNTTAVALVGGIALIPMVLAGPIGGMITDAFDRRTVLIVSATVMFLATAGLLWLSVYEQAVSHAIVRVYSSTPGAEPLILQNHAPLWPFYVFTTISAISGVVLSGARQAVVPRIMSPELVTRASALNGISMGTQIMGGPALAGVIVAFSSYPVAFATDLVFTAAGFLGVATLPKLPVQGEGVRLGWAAFKESIDFVRSVPQVGAGFLIDIIAMSLGRPYVLLPAAATAVIGGGPMTVGILTAAGAVGSFATSAFSGRVVHIRRQGLAIANAVKVYGLFTALLGLILFVMGTGWFGHPGASFAQVNVVALVAASLAMFGTGASDEVSAIFRTSMLLQVAPDQIRGRLQGLFVSVVQGGPRLGDIYAGAMAALLGLWAGPLLGGIVTIVAMFVILRVTPKFREFVAE